MVFVMKKLSFLLFTFWCVTYCVAQAYSHESAFGFKIDIPEGWTVVTAEELKKTVDLLGNSSDISPEADPQIMEEVKERIASGDVEFYLRKKGGTVAFVDNVNVSKGGGRVPKNAATAKSECDAAPAELGRFFGRAVMVYECGLREVAGHEAMYVDFEGMSKGLRSLSYRIQWTPDVILTFTATCRTESLDVVKKEFNEMLATLR
jgi:hypothetical protein